ncbi:hypothetical protein BV372_12745 [Nostoc sp. T09]|uniref:JAB N-terminal domain-containing protein n=1 Tax=Nostoc sp. T09 TaxID=1932621 RepID=UPI000A36C038|nr:JAB N-terminal domain-containing protein [Nostoc sp. T09]OUL34969.1 hypothetical protein BV372_12745 [Nostoc sp. T09]
MKERDDYRIELYRGADRKFFGTMPFLPIVQESLESLLGRSLLLKSILVILLQVPEEPLPIESPVVENLVPDFGYTYIKVYQGNFLIYQHPHRLYDVLTKNLRTKLSNQYPEEIWWGFRVDIPGMPQISAFRLNPRVSTLHPTPAREGNAEIIPYPHPHGEKPKFQIRRLAEAEPPLKTLADFGITSGQTAGEIPIFGNQINPVLVESLTAPETGERITQEKNFAPQITTSQDQINKAPVKIVLARSLYQNLCHQRPLSQKVEEGGFLVGNVYRDGDEENTYLVEVSNALTAQHTGASFLHLTFTGDSFVEVKRTLNQSHSGERLLGWYHTHLFPATPTFGLSSIDVELHFSTFTIPWQLAGLINLDGNQRTLRFYVRQGNKMVLCPYWVIDERH